MASVSEQGVHHGRSLFSHSLIWNTIEPNQVEKFRPEFAQWQPIVSFALMVEAFY
jgi:hypothetical protein